MAEPTDTADIVSAAKEVLENATPDGNGNVIVPGWAFRNLYEAFGMPNLTAKDAIFGGMREVTGG